ncbi:hypothetical protein [Ferrovibrio sp.]|uniref:hypothetical protein n=1 Tax=Ferrovibrio sp. TaxID=1917215 RepID=UPI0035151833
MPTQEQRRQAEKQDRLRRDEKKNRQAAVFSTAVPAGSVLDRWLHEPNVDGTRDERGRGTAPEQSAENAARNALLQHHDFEAADRLLGRAIALCRRPPEGSDDDDHERPKSMGRLMKIQTDVGTARIKYAQAMRGRRA